MCEDNKSAMSDTSASLNDSSIPDNNMTSNQTEAGNASVSATIAITMYTGDDE
jgi:hypothetical protein